MKKLLPLLTLCMGLCCVSCYDDSPILERLDVLEKNAIASINEQINAIKASITSLEAVDAELKSTIKDLEAKDGSLQGDIDKLKEADTSLETKIGELKTYVDAEISNTEDWATATFATLEQYDSLCVVLTGIETSISGLKEEFTKNLSDAISNSEESMQGWVNEQLTGYWTIAETQARLDTLKQTHNEDIEKLSADLSNAKEEMTEAYTIAISNAIDELDGKLSDEITKINEDLTKRLDDIETRLSAIEETLKNLTRDFKIEFDDYDIGILAGGTTSVGYTITGATDKITVKALGQNGWSAKVTPNGADKGTITVTAPNPMSNDEIIVLVYDGEFRTIMSTINFVTGVVTPSQTAVELEAEAGTVEITVTSNLNYQISIPDEAKEWFSVVETKATKTETITFAYTSNNGNIRRCLVNFTDNDGKIISSVTFVQKKVIVMEDAIDLSANGTANCYMIPEAGWFKFNASVKGNSQESVGELSGVEVLWETFNTNEKPQEGDIVSKVLLSENYVYLKTSDDYKNGNALIAVKDINGVILWSWHIWVTDYDPLTSYDTYVASQAIMMNRDLGALTTTQGDTRTLGLFFQWGRKDPFFGDDFQSTLSSYSIEESSAEKGTTIYATNNPTTFITYTSRTDYDWHYNYRDNNLWAIDKTIYDPCPNGWKVPEWSYYSGGNSDGLWNTGVWLNFYSPGNKDAVFDSNLKGIMFSTYYSIPETWYQCHGELSADYGIRKNVRSGRWWAVMDSQSTITSGRSQGLTISSSGAMTNSSQGRATGNIIRCQKE